MAQQTATKLTPATTDTCIGCREPAPVGHPCPTCHDQVKAAAEALTGNDGAPVKAREVYAELGEVRAELARMRREVTTDLAELGRLARSLDAHVTMAQHDAARCREMVDRFAELIDQPLPAPLRAMLGGILPNGNAPAGKQ